MRLDQPLNRQRDAVREVEDLCSRARAELESGRDASVFLWLARRALREFGRRRARRAAERAE
jgi:hypothetical protein